MVWLKPSDYGKQQYLELRLYAPKGEKILLDFNPLKVSDEPKFDVCFDNWIGKEDWLKLIAELERDLEGFSEEEKQFYIDFLNWIKEALNYTSIIVVEGNQ